MKEQLLNRMIKLYGFEHNAVIAFAELIEQNIFTNDIFEDIVKAHEKHPIIEEEEEN